MKFDFITFRSVTVAQRGEGALRRAGIECSLQRTPKWMSERGCGYCLRLRQSDLEKSAEVLRQSGVPISRIYRRGDDGSLEVLDS